MKPIATALFAALFLITIAPPVGAQESSKDATWYRVFLIKFEPGRAPEGIAFIKGHFNPVDEQIGRKTLPFEFITGDWDHIVFFPATLSEAGLDTIPPEHEWMAMFEEREGGKAEAQAAFAEFNGLVAELKVQIARTMR